MKKKLYLFICLVFVSFSLSAYSLQGSLMEALVTNNQTRILGVIKNKPDLTFFDKDAIYQEAIENEYKENTIVELLLSGVCLPSENSYVPIYQYALSKGYKTLITLLSPVVENPAPYLEKATYLIDMDNLLDRLLSHPSNDQDEVDPFSEVGISLSASGMADLTISFGSNGEVVLSDLSEDKQVGNVLSFDPFNRVMIIDLGGKNTQIVFSPDYDLLDLGGVILFKSV